MAIEWCESARVVLCVCVHIDLCKHFSISVWVGGEALDVNVCGCVCVFDSKLSPFCLSLYPSAFSPYVR